MDQEEEGPCVQGNGEEVSVQTGCWEDREDTPGGFHFLTDHRVTWVCVGAWEKCATCEERIKQLPVKLNCRSVESTFEIRDQSKVLAWGRRSWREV